jgi:hypothetical protein
VIEAPEAQAPPIDLALATPETVFAERMPGPAAERPWPSSRRAIFFDVENTSQVSHIARVIDHLRVDRTGQRTDFIAVGNWRVIGHDTARILAKSGAQLVHSAPSVGVRDWSDLRIAVGAGVWLASARPGDVIEIISDDRAFDAVGDVAASLGIVYRRLSYRSLTGATSAPVVESAPVAESRSDRGRRGRRRGRGGHRRESSESRGRAPHRAASAPMSPASSMGGRPAPAAVQLGPEPHTAPHDELVAVVRDLTERAPGHHVTLDALANALKQRGFSRPPGSPRLITRLRRIKALDVNRAGVITFVGDGPTRGDEPGHGDEPSRDEMPSPRDGGSPREVPSYREMASHRDAPSHRQMPPQREMPDDSELEHPDDIDGNAAPRTSAAAPSAAGDQPPGGRRRRSRRGGRRHRRRGAVAPAAEAP